MAFVFLVFYVLALLVRPQEWYDPVRGLELVNVAAILTIFATFLTQQRDGGVFHVVFHNRYARLMWGLLSAVVLSHLVRLRFHSGLDAFSEFGKSCVLMLAAMLLVDDPSRLRKMMWVVIISAAVFCIHGIMQVQTGYGFANVQPFGSFATGDFRIQGTGMFSDPNDFAMLYIVAIPFVFTMLQTQTMVIGKVFVLAAFPAMLYVIYFTQSRGGVVGLGAMMMGYVWYSIRQKFIRVLIGVVGLAVIVAFGPARARSSVYEGSAGGRIIQWGNGNQFLKENPLFGIGYQRWLEFSDQVAHNSFVTCYGELGLVGYAFWFSLGFLVLRTLYRITALPNLDRPTRRLVTGLYAALIGFYASAFFLTRTYNPFLYLLLGMGIGTIRYIDRLQLAPPGYLDITGRDFRRSALMSVLSIPAIYVIVRAYWIGGGAGG